MEEEKKIRIIAMMNHLKDNINPAWKNKYYQKWCKNKKGNFRNFVIEEIKKDILKELDNE